MTQDATSRIGKIIEGEAGRDAIHVPVLPMLAVRVMQPGERLKNGVVDPWLDEPIQPGQWYYLWIKPGTVTSLEHVWRHPAFPLETTNES